MDNQKEYKRYVAHFDMLGFKTATLRNPDEAWGALSDLQACMDAILKKHIEVISTKDIISDRIKAYIFSDSILMFSVGDKIQDLVGMLILTSELFKETLHFCVPIRGGISFGDFFYNLEKSLFCGIPFVKAYMIGEEAQWCGIVVDDNVANHYFKLPKNIGLLSQDRQPIIIKWDVPLKDKNNRSNKMKKTWVVNWPVIFRHNFKETPPISVQDYYEPFRKLFGPYEDLHDDIKAKYVNTVSFINSNL